MILLDTHVVLWLAQGTPNLSQRATAAVSEARQEQSGLAIAGITLWELAMMVARKRIEITIPLEAFLSEIESTFVVLPLTAAIARRAMEFTSRYPKDPMDRIIGGTALVEGLSLITRDETIRASGEVRCIW